MNAPERQIEDEAIGWIVRMREPDFADWDGFTRWLEQDPRHNGVYETMALADEDSEPLVDALKNPPVSPLDRGIAEPERPVFKRRAVLGFGIAASATAIVAGYTLLDTGPALTQVATADGERRNVTLADGSRIAINGGTRLVYAADGRFARLDRGEALFTVVHNDADPFIVETGGTVLRDAGTIFNVAAREDVTDIAVSEGAVIVNPERQAIRLDAGQALQIAEGRLLRRDVALGDVASWREDRLIYHNMPLPVVASDISRNTGVPIAVAPDLATERFTGVLRLDEDPNRFVPTLGRLVGAEARESETGWTLSRG
ncbi:MAG: FecR family protein [Parasphingopyxis sp.]|uniref:FecR family protein n=1 Tax=Parasphingopyxis sp. TaxID=1920299 RepID=UPI003FA02AE3